MIEAVPRDTPVTIPVDGSMVATPVLPDVQVPPVTVSLSPDVAPRQTNGLPVITTGAVATVTVTVERQPVGNV